MMEWYDRTGRLITTEEANALIGNFEYKRVELTEVNGYVISTVWLGLDHSFGDGGPPLIFETMVFTGESWEGEDLLLDLDMRRYSTETEAIQGHAETVLLVEATTSGDNVRRLPFKPFSPTKKES